MARSAFLLFLLASLGLLGGCAQFASKLAEKIYPSLDLPWSADNAPTATTFPASADIRAVLGGRGEGLSCSIPRILETLFLDSAATRDAPVSLQFRQACLFHDYCYRHGHATYGYTKEDCDILFQEHAYRICRQISVLDASQDECRDRARVALLGLNFGGGKSFRHAHRSTYFEFDPLPVRASAYQVARIVRRTPQPLTGGLRADGALWWISIKDGWMAFHQLEGVDPASKWSKSEGGTPFMREKVPVAPFVVRDGTRDRLVWLARRGLANSGVLAFAVDATDVTQVAQKLSQKTSFGGTEDTKCGYFHVEEDRTAAAEAIGYSRLEYDCGTSISKPVAVPCDGQSSKPTVATLGVHHWTVRFPRRPGTEVPPCQETRATLGLLSTRPPIRSIRQFGYRFAQSEFLSGRFGSYTGTDLIALGRGFHGDAASAEEQNRVGQQYEASVTVAWLSRTGENPIDPAVPIGEDSEPLASFEADSADVAPDRLIALVNPYPKTNDCAIRVREWQPGASWLLSENILELPAAWLAQPPQVVVSRGTKRGDRLFLSKAVTPERNGSTLDDEAFVPEEVRLDYRVLRRAQDRWREEGGGCLRVDISKQIKEKEGPGLIDRYLYRRWRWLVGDSKGSYAPDLVTPATLCAEASAASIEEAFRNGQDPQKSYRPDELNWHGIKACVALRREIATRWHRAQVIPAYLFASEDVAEKADRPLDVAFVFNGFRAHSVVAHLGKPVVGGDWATTCDK